MRICVLRTLLVASAVAFAVGQTGLAPVRAQSTTPVQPQQTPKQSDQSRDQDRARAEDVKIERDWKARESGNTQAGSAATDKSHETVGRDWRAHPENRNR